VNQTGQTSNYPSADSGWAGEIALDVEAVSAVYPNANILLVEANSASDADLYTRRHRRPPGRHVVTNSWGGSEYSGQTTTTPHFPPRGRAIFVSSGDTGAEAGAQYPAASQYVIAVGGTKLTKDSARALSKSSGTTPTQLRRGSGVSKYETKPDLADGHRHKRTVADISAVAYPSFAVYDTYAAAAGRPTAERAWRARWWRDLRAHRHGSADASLAYRNTGTFYDITSGNNRVKTRTRPLT